MVLLSYFFWKARGSCAEVTKEAAFSGFANETAITTVSPRQRRCLSLGNGPCDGLRVSIFPGLVFGCVNIDFTIRRSSFNARLARHTYTHIRL